jgi:hypothetical protein
MHSNEFHNNLVAAGFRIFGVVIDGETVYWIHGCKTRNQWRIDVRAFLASSKAENSDSNGHAGDSIYNALSDHLTALGYNEVADVVSDVYEGRISNTSAKLVDDPDHEEQKDGFGHYGWESKLPE